MELRPVTGKALEDWYDRELSEAFPPNERKPLPDIRALMDAGRYEVWGLFDGDTMLGYATLWMEPTDKSCILLDYLGVTAARRNGGLGQKIVRMLAEQMEGKSLLLIEAERPVEGGDPAENNLRRRRLAFYERCGFVPAYDMATCGMRFATFLPYLPQDLTPVMALHRAIYGPERTDVKVPLEVGELPPGPPAWMKEGESLT
ncbi:GNAT family N-acetyltransferase [Intestinimonas massiliensis (ex Afouda et al. 2020)]|uniref:GNAT family N-acetyltransferase n=1 Tax=Intestinimonas massiliensis (ex Afouda et al. 2020) TaxID=1673721 RepID=UPI00102F8916|nr:GNAT family N-acetyltransferase [Intestinimonas massiliensis (ex Afouda et al. 2020)]